MESSTKKALMYGGAALGIGVVGYFLFFRAKPTLTQGPQFSPTSAPGNAPNPLLSNDPNVFSAFNPSSAAPSTPMSATIVDPEPPRENSFEYMQWSIRQAQRNQGATQGVPQGAPNPANYPNSPQGKASFENDMLGFFNGLAGAGKTVQDINKAYNMIQGVLANSFGYLLPAFGHVGDFLNSIPGINLGGYTSFLNF